jgi:hypothetical protein
MSLCNGREGAGQKIDEFFTGYCADAPANQSTLVISHGGATHLNYSSDI